MQHVPRSSFSLAICGALACAIAFGPTSERAVAQTPPPPPAPNATTRLATPGPTLPPATSAPSPSAAPLPTASATATPSRRGRKGRPKPATSSEPSNPEPSATPTSPAFATLDGTWEVQLQYIDRTEYSYLTIVQGAGGTLSGTWRVNNKTYPFEGTYDGRVIRMLVKKPLGNVTMSGYVEGASDMVGTVDLGDGKADPTAFTAEHRPSSKGSVFKKGL